MRPNTKGGAEAMFVEYCQNGYLVGIYSTTFTNISLSASTLNYSGGDLRPLILKTVEMHIDLVPVSLDHREREALPGFEAGK